MKFYTLDTALATFQFNNNKDNDDKKEDLKYSVKVTDTDKIKEVQSIQENLMKKEM